MEEKKKMKIVKLTFFKAVDENGKYHTIENPPFENKEEVLLDEVEGIYKSEWKQDKYADGSFARSETEHTSFKIIES